MKSRFNFCGNVERCPKVLSFGKTQIHLVFRSLTRTLATTFMVATAITIVSCSQDDDDYNSDMYTLAEKMETRSGGDPGGFSLMINLNTQPFTSTLVYTYATGIQTSRSTTIVYSTDSLFQEITCSVCIEGVPNNKISTSFLRKDFEGDTAFVDFNILFSTNYHDGVASITLYNQRLERSLFH